MILPAATQFFLGSIDEGDADTPAQVGPKAPTLTGVSGTGNVWVDTDFIKLSDGQYATNSIALDEFTETLHGYSFGFTVPTGDTIDGIELKFERKAASADVIIDRVIRVTKLAPPSIPTGENKKFDQIAFWPTVDTVVTYGGERDLWGLNWTPEEINAAGFGVGISAFQEVTTAVAISVDSVTLSVWHHTPSGVMRNRVARGIRRRITSFNR